MEEIIEKTLKALERNGFGAYYAGSGQDAARMIMEMIPVNETVGIGDSATLRQIGVPKMLKEDGRVVIDPFDDRLVERMNTGEVTAKDNLKYSRMALGCDWFVTGTNVLTMNGILMNTDCTGNRVAGMFFGPENSIMVVGKNKIVPDTEAGYDRLRNICGAFHSKTKQRKNPCVKAGKCVNCNSGDRLCRITTILEKRPKNTNANVLIIDDDLGLGWDRDWDAERIDRIYYAYAAVTLMKRPAWMDQQS